ncbi:MAG TPA: GIY-YIG nuclease family protein [Flavobacteriales bacterium]|nr:GIY-YIG nuclease family protein [Flavobacteriales bacterium]HNE80173.1 GIY-YIG nuclease family protein [Flavobacteriales bacterium]HNI04785.1 GIY-YIG nuclease family protein [Flavobacteriales bacterium]HNM68259.1 GIY-YIG nuclease family protein [Flavobacteriales bacterium]HNO06487.1 GIY-YIG nuclease family protein [Flavobacteriales bacterium]
MTFSHHVYILLCAEGLYYVGCTSDLDARMERHGQGAMHYTRDKLPVRCVAAFSFPDKYKAFAFEKYLKSGSGRAFMSRHLI